MGSRNSYGIVIRSDNKYVCLSAQEICTNNYPYLISDTKECVKTCKGTDYNILYNNECKSSCGNDMERLTLSDSNISDYTCVCKYIWAENSGCSADNADKKCWDKFGGATEEEWTKGHYKWKCQNCEHHSKTFTEFIENLDDSNDNYDEEYED